MWRDIEAAAVSRKAPLMAAKLGVDEGAMWRELKAFMVEVQTECSKLDVEKGLRTDIEERDDAEGGNARAP